MFKVIRTNVYQSPDNPDQICYGPVAPMFYVICDERTCGWDASGPADLATPQSRGESQTAFIAQLQSQGWQIGINAQICPGCVRMLMERAARDGQIKKVQPATVDQQRFAERAWQSLGPGLKKGMG